MSAPCFIASGNRAKAAELMVFARKHFPEFLDLRARAARDAEENGTSFLANAEIKAAALDRELRAEGLRDYYILADDSGLVVPALNGAPGIYSARYAGPGAGDAANVQKLLQALQGETRREAFFSCALVLYHRKDSQLVRTTAEGTCPGQITLSAQGQTGFGYDPVFYSPALGKTFGDASEDEKNSISHRGDAFQKLRLHWKP